MKEIRIILLSLLTLASVAAQASSSISLSSVQGVPRDTLTVTVDLNTTDAVSAVDITIPLGSYLKYAPNSVVLNSARSNGHYVSASQVGDDLRLVIYSLSLSTLNGQSGELLRFDLVLGREPGVYALTPQVVLGSASGATITSSSTAGTVVINASKMALSTSQIDFGHIPIRSSYTQCLTIYNTGTSALNISSITFNDAEMSCQIPSAIAAGSSHTLAINYSPMTHGAATAEMTIVSDAVNGNQKVNIVADPFSVNELHVMHAEGVSDDTVDVFLTMNNMEPIVGMQCSFVIPDGLDAVPNSFSVAPRSVNHMATSTLSHDTLTLMAYSLNNTPFTGNDDTLGSFKVRLNGASNWYYLNPENVVLANASGVNMVSAAYGEYVVVSAPYLYVSQQLDMGNVSVTDTSRVGLQINNYSNIDLIINNVTFLAEGYRMTSQLPMVIQGYGYDTLWVEHNPTKEGNFNTTMQIYSNDPASRMTSVNVHGVAFEPNEINLKGRRQSDGKYALTVGLDNYSDIVAMQMDIHWLDSMNTGSSALTLKPRANGMMPMISKMSDGTYRVALFSMTNTPLTGHDGDVFQLVYDGQCNYNNTNIVVDNLIASTSDGVNKISVPVESLYVDIKQIDVSCDNTRGSVSGGGLYNNGDTAVLVAAANSDYHFVDWSNGAVDDTLLILVNDDISLTARFMHNPYLFDESYAICQSEVYQWHNRQLTEAGVYYDSLKTSENVDSVYRLTLTVNPTYLLSKSTSMCQGMYCGWRDRAFTESGVYYDSLQTVNGCDSVYQLILTVNPKYFFADAYSICQGETYSWHNKVLNASGVYYDSLLSVYGCDSVYQLTLTVNPTFFYEESYAICQGSSYSWHNRVLNVAGVYYDSLQTINGCYSVYKLTLIVNPTYLYEESHAICQGESYTWHNKVLTASGIYYDSLQTINGCDSVYQLTLTANPTYFIEESYSICQGGSYSWRNKDLSAAGIYYDSLKTINGCDSVYELTLTVNPTFFYEESNAICQGESYNWHNKVLSASGVYYDSLHSINGCDSVYELTLTVNPKYFIQQSVKWPSTKGNYTWHERLIAGTGVYYDSLLTVSGCDSVYELDIEFADNYLFVENGAVCQGESYTWRGRQYTTSGVYYDSLRTTDNILDSVYQLTLTIHPTYFYEESHAICQGGSYSWHNRVLNASGVYYDSLQTINGCDSVYELTLTVNPTFFYEESHAICQGESYNWHNMSIATAGIYYDSLLTINGCDSVYKLIMTVNPNYFFADAYSICQGGSYSWHNRVLNASGVYYDSLQTINGCDSVYELTLTVNNTYFIPSNHAICNGESYSWHNKVLSASGVYYDSLHSINGCDSVYQLTLTVNPTYFIQEAYSICQGVNYSWHNRIYNTSGVYYDTLRTATGCDSVCQLTLTVGQSYFVRETYYICQGESYTWHNRVLNASGVYLDSLQTVSGCDSVCLLTLLVNPTYFIQQSYTMCQGESYTWHNKVFTSSGVYYDSLQTINGCDSVYQLTLTVKPVSVTELTYDACENTLPDWASDVVSPGTYNYSDTLRSSNGCDSIVNITLNVHPVYVVRDTAELPSDGSGYLWNGTTYYDAGNYYLILSTEMGCDSVCMLNLTDPVVVAVDDASTMMITLAPNPVKTGEVAYLYADGDGVDGKMMVEIVGMTGQVVRRFETDSFPVAVDGLGASGAYLVRLTTRDGKVYTRKLIVSITGTVP